MECGYQFFICNEGCVDIEISEVLHSPYLKDIMRITKISVLSKVVSMTWLGEHFA